MKQGEIKLEKRKRHSNNCLDQRLKSEASLHWVTISDPEATQLGNEKGLNS